jgi:hypothetical protein
MVEETFNGCQLPSILALNGLIASTLSETKVHAHHAGLLPPLKFLVTVSASPQTERSTLLLALNTRFPATQATRVAMEVT